MQLPLSSLEGRSHIHVEASTSIPDSSDNVEISAVVYVEKLKVKAVKR